MLVRQLFDAESCSYTYLLISDSGSAIIIDPVRHNVDMYLQLLEQLKARLLFTVDTHTHADHISGSGLLSKRVGCDIVMGKYTDVKGVDIYLMDNELLKMDNIQLRAIYTPGHTKDSYCYQLNDMLFTGDTLLIRGTGRCDFQDSSPRKQYNSIFAKLFLLPEQTLIYPGHDYNGMTVSSLGEEKIHNLRLQVETVEEYENLMNNLELPMPRHMGIAIPLNLNCGLTESEFKSI